MKVEKDNSSTKRFLSDARKCRAGGGYEDNYNYFISDGNEMKEKRKLRINGEVINHVQDMKAYLPLPY